jgi:phosphoglycolate phosphatase-like HAD superfamily hydrolase
VVWDWNGTLFDDVPLVVEAVNTCLRSRRGPRIDAETYRRRFERPLHRFYEGLLGEPIDDVILAELDEVFQKAYWAGFDTVGLTADAVEAVDAVEAAGATQSIASMLWHDMLVPTVRAFGLDDRMLALDGNRGKVGDTKDQHMVGHVTRLRSLFPSLDGARMVVVGDIVDDAAAAAAAGIDCVLYDGGSQLRSDLEAAGVPVVDSLLEAIELILD